MAWFLIVKGPKVMFARTMGPEDEEPSLGWSGDRKSAGEVRMISEV